MDRTLQRERIVSVGGVLASMQLRLVRAFGPREADAILAAAKRRIHAAPVDERLDVAIDIVEERCPGAIDFARHRPGVD